MRWWRAGLRSSNEIPDTMTNESDSTASGASRPPPTIELTATEVDPPAADSAKTESKTETTAESATQDAAQDPAAAKPAARASFNPLSHAISAAIGAGAALLVLAGLWLAGFTTARDVINAQSGMPQGADADVAARLDKIEHAIQAQKPDAVAPAVNNRLTAVEMQTKMLGDSAATLNHRVDDIAATAQAAQKDAASAATAAAAAKSAGQAGVQPGDLTALSSRIGALEAAVKTLSEQVAHPTSGVDQAVRLTVAAQALQAALERGAPYQAELKAVQALGAAPGTTAPLEPFAATGLPRADALAHDLAALLPALRQAADTTPADATYFEKLKANVQNLVQITPVDAPPGNDPTAVITRIAIDANRADIAAALREIAALPDRAKPIAADWAKAAQAREAAIAASRNITAGAVAALSQPAAQ
jgi:hypothetical protein